MDEERVRGRLRLQSPINDGHTDSETTNLVSKQGRKFEQRVGEVVQWVCDARFKESEALNSDSELVIVRRKIFVVLSHNPLHSASSSVQQV